MGSERRCARVASYIARIVRSRLLPAIWIVPVFVAAGLIFLRRAGLHYHASSELAGYPATLCLLSDGDLPRYDISFTLIQPSKTEKSWVAGLIADPRNLFIDHTPDAVVFRDVREHLGSIAAAAGYRRETVTTIADRNHRPRFEIFRYVAR